MNQRLSLDGLPFAEHPALFGADRAPGLVAADDARKGVITTWWRHESGIEVREEPFRPFLWLTDEGLLSGYDGEVEVVPLQGEGEFRFVVRAADMFELRAVSKHIGKTAGLAANHSDSPQLFLSDQVHQYLLDTGRTFFGGMAFGDLRRMQVHVAADVAEGAEFCLPERDPILMLALSDNTGWVEILTTADSSEKAVLEAFVARVVERDPDVIEGHNLFKGAMPYLAARAKALKVKLTMGRGGGAPRSRMSRMQIAEKTLDYPRWDLQGRDFLDTWILAQLYDVSSRELESLSLEDVAKQLGVARTSGGWLQEWEYPREFRRDRAAAEALLRQDVEEVRAMADLLSYPYFLQAQIFPYSYQNVVIRGNATRINSLFLREYLRQRTALPARPAVKPFMGGLTAQEHEGLAWNVLHCDVQSLYPSLMLTYRTQPKGDTLDIFLGMLSQLRQFRLEARRMEREARDAEERRFYGALQNTFKILINSFYGYLGFAQGNFADFDRAAEVTQRGRDLLQKMIAWLKGQGARILEVDTDGIYFVPPPSLAGEEAEIALVEALNDELPDGLKVDLDGRYRSMYCHKMKNYALLDAEGRVTLRGSGLRSRSLEPFLREALEEMLTLALQGRQEEIPGLFDRVSEDLWEHRIPAKKLARTETLSESPEAYQRKIEAGARNRAAAYELAGAGDRRLRAGDTVSYYITGEKATVTAYDNCRMVTEHDPTAPDENPAYYQKKLRELYKKFGPTLGLREWK